MILLQEEIVSRCLTEAGQVFIDPKVLRFTDDRIRRDILLPCIKEYQAFRPPVVWEHLYLTSDGWSIPSRVRRINGLRPLWLFYWPYMGAAALRPIPRMEAQKWYQSNGILYGPPGRYELEYISNEGYKIGYEVDRYGIYELFKGEKEVTFTLRSGFRKGTLNLFVSGGPGGTDLVSATDDAEGAVNPVLGDWLEVDSSVNYATYNVSLKLTDESQALLFPDGVTKVLIEASYASTNPGVVGLDFSEIYFYALFASKFLPAFAATRSIVRIDGLPVEMNTDGLLEYARQQQELWIQSKEQRQSWWRW